MRGCEYITHLQIENGHRDTETQRLPVRELARPTGVAGRRRNRRIAANIKLRRIDMFVFAALRRFLHAASRRVARKSQRAMRWTPSVTRRELKLMRSPSRFFVTAR